MLLDPHKQTTVLARRWDSSRSALYPIVPGATLESVVFDAIQGMRRDGLYTRAQARVLSRYARCRVDGIEIKRSQWADTRPHEGARIEVLQGVKGGGGGGGGKSPIATVLSVVVIAAAVSAPWLMPELGSLVFSTGSFFTASGAITAAGSMLTAGIMMGGLYAVNQLFPVSQPSLGAASTGDLAKDSPTYSITGARNAANPLGYVPLVLGKHRHTPPLGAKSWTKWEGPDQYFNMLVVWGHAGMNVSDFRIGKTPLSDFKNVQHVFHAATYGDGLQLFGKSYNEQSVGALLKASDGWVTRNIGVCEDISVDIAANAMCELDKKTGSPRTRTVHFQLQYATTGQENWSNVGSNTVNIRAAQRTVGDYPPGIEIRANMDGTVEFGWVSWQPVDASAYPIELWPNKDSRVAGCEVTFSGATASVAPGVYNNSDSVYFSAATRSSVVRNYRIGGLPRADRKVRMRRLTGDSGSQYILDECSWSTARAILNQPAFNSPVPLCVSELRIKANEQLSGYVDDFNGLCESVMPCWNGTAWVDAPTSNPAAHMRYLLTSRAGLQEPYSLAKVDDATLVELYQYAETNGYKFNFIADTEQNVWSRLVQVLAPARAAPTTDVDALWGVVIDNADKEPTQMFTPRNSWGWKVNKTMPRLPHALRVKFVDETQDYAQVEQFVYMDGYSVDGAGGTEKATYIIEWDYAGVTTWPQLYALAREHLARLLHRAQSVTLNTDWEWMATRRGKLVRAYSDILMNTFPNGGAARVERLVYDIDGEEIAVGREADIPTDEHGAPLIPIGMQLDDTLVFNEPAPARYCVVVRDEHSRLTVYEIVPEYGDEEHDTIYFQHALSSANVPPLRSLCTVGLLEGENYAEYLVVSMEHGENNSAEITLIPWAIGPIKAAASGPIPPYNPSIILDVTKGSSLPTPIVRDIRSDESVLIRSASGGITSRIAVWWEVPATTADITNYQMSATAVTTQDRIMGVGSSQESFVAVSGVEDGWEYDVMIRAIAADGRTSAWSETVRHKVVGKTSRPPDVTNFKAEIVDAGGISLSWDAVTVLDLAAYRISGDASMETTSTQFKAQVYKKTGNIEFSCVAVDTVRLTSTTPATASVTVQPPAAPVLTAKASVGGAIIRWKDCAKTWPIASYTIVDTDDANETYVLNSLELAMTPRGVGTYQFKATAEDKFQNRSTTSTNNITVTRPADPVPAINIDGADIVVSWPMVASFFPIDFYEVYTVDWTLGKKSKSNNVRFPATGVGVQEYRVRAVDVAGNASGWVEVHLTISAPEPPDVSIALNENKDGCILSWSDTGSSLPIVAWDVVRQWDNDLGGGIIETLEEDFGRLDVDSLLVPSVAVGEHHYMVRGIDSAGNRSLWGEVVFTAMAPGKVTFSSSSVIDNNLLLYWTDPDSVFFAIAYYVFSQVDSDGYEMEVGRIDARFASSFESVSGEYTYRVTPVDTAGNRGESADISMTISQPPDFMLFHDYDSLFNGSKTNLELDGRGSMYGPVVMNETWQANTDRVAALLSTTAANLTWQQRVNAGYGYYNSPYSGTATYVEIVDVGTVIPSTKITVTVSRTKLEGNPNLTCKIETSLNKSTWTVAAANAFETYATDFRYVRYTFTVSGGLLQFRNINYSLNIKRKTDFGTVSVTATDNGAGYPGDPMQAGKWVPFNIPFTDVNGAPVCTIVNNSTTNPLTPYTVFVDTLNPTGFRIFALDKNGNRAAATISWMVQGV